MDASEAPLKYLNPALTRAESPSFSPNARKGTVACPLTVWETQLRILSGATVPDQTFIEKIFRQILFWDLPLLFFEVCYGAFFIIMLMTYLLIKPVKKTAR